MGTSKRSASTVNACLGNSLATWVDDHMECQGLTWGDIQLWVVIFLCFMIVFDDPLLRIEMHGHIDRRLCMEYILEGLSLSLSLLFSLLHDFFMVIRYCVVWHFSEYPPFVDMRFWCNLWKGLANIVSTRGTYMCTCWRVRHVILQLAELSFVYTEIYYSFRLLIYTYNYKWRTNGTPN